MRADPRFKPLPPEPATLVNEGRTIEAIKVLRQSEGIGLKQAKDWVDWHIAQDPMLAAQLACAGEGILRVNEWVIREPLARGELVEVLPEWSCYRLGGGGLPVYVVYAQTASATPPLKSRVFVDLLKEVLAHEDLPSRAPPGKAKPVKERG